MHWSCRWQTKCAAQASRYNLQYVCRL